MDMDEDSGNSTTLGLGENVALSNLVARTNTHIPADVPSCKSIKSLGTI